MPGAMDAVTIYSDGACLGNPGRGGYGSGYGSGFGNNYGQNFGAGYGQGHIGAGHGQSGGLTHVSGGSIGKGGVSGYSGTLGHDAAIVALKATRQLAVGEVGQVVNDVLGDCL